MKVPQWSPGAKPHSRESGKKPSQKLKLEIKSEMKLQHFRAHKTLLLSRNAIIN